MNDEPDEAAPDTTPKAVEEALDVSRERSEALGKALDEAEVKHPVKPDHADEGGVV